MTKVAIIGIDGLDSILLSKFEDYLPHFKKLKEESPKLGFVSVFPPDSMTAWMSAYTGLNPARHGVVNFVNATDKSKKLLFENVADKFFQGRTFWDIAGKHGKKSCLVLPYAIFPPYPINGVMVCRSLAVADVNSPIKIFPSGYSGKYKLNSKLNLFQGFPSRRQLPAFANSCKDRTIAEADLAFSIMDGEDWDIFFTYFSALDAVQHTFWSYYDEKHPDYPGRNQYSTEIRDLYILVDSIIGKIKRKIGSNTPMIVLSDHGGGARPTKMVRVNELLRKKGYLFPVAKGLKRKPVLNYDTLLKRFLPDLINRFGLGNSSIKVLHRFPVWKKMFASPSFINWTRTIAYVSDLSAVKSYSYGGVMINQKNLGAHDYEELRESLIAEISKIVEPSSGEKLVRWVCKREAVYRGEYISDYPDVLFELNGDYGISWQIGEPLINLSHAHRFQPGGHKMHSPVLLLANLQDKKIAKSNCTLMDIAPTVLNLFGISGTFNFDGSSIIGNQT